MAASIRDVAQLAGVSISTVSNVMTGKKPVSRELATRVNSAVENLAYMANPMASGLKSSKSNTIGVIITTFQSLFFGQVLKGIQDTVFKKGFMVNVFDSNNSLANEKRYIERLVSSLSDGVILLSLADYNDPGDVEYLRSVGKLSINGKRVPVVGLERTLGPADADAVICDNRSAAAEVTGHLIDKGHRKIAHITGLRHMEMSELRLLGYKDALLKAGIKHGKELVASGDFTPYSGYACMWELLKKTKCTAVFAANDQMAIGAIKAIKEKGLKIPEDIAVAGFDNIFPGTLINPSLTTISVPAYQMGRIAANMLMERISGKSKGPGEKRTLRTRLIVRRSTDIGGERAWDLNNW